MLVFGMLDEREECSYMIIPSLSLSQCPTYVCFFATSPWIHLPHCLKLENIPAMPCGNRPSQAVQI